jgi:hypothetical protein
MNQNTTERFINDLDFNAGGMKTCCEWLDLDTFDHIVIRDSIKLLDRLTETLYHGCRNEKDYKKYLRVNKIKEMYEAKKASKNK